MLRILSSKSLGIVLCVVGFALSGVAMADDLYPVGRLVQGDDIFACGSEALAEKIQKIGLAPENAGAIIENNDCFYLDRFDHTPVRHGKVSNDLLVLETHSKRMGTFFAIVPLKP